jgi:AraC-like DNA-binding protein
VGILLSAILIYYNARDYKSSVYLGTFFLLVSAYGITQYLLFYSDSIVLISIVVFYTGFLPYLVGPALFLYVRSVLRDDHQLKRSDLLHLVPLLLFLMVAFPKMMIPWEEKEQIAGIFYESLRSSGVFNTSFLGSKFLTAANFVIPVVITLGYVFWSYGLLVSYLKQKKLQQVFLKQRPAIKWIKGLLNIEVLLVTGALIMAVNIFVFGNLKGIFSLQTIFNILGTGPVAIIILIFFSPSILYGLPRSPGGKVQIIDVKDEVEDDLSAKRIIAPRFESEYIESIGIRVDACMKEFQPYLKPDCNLAYISKLVKIPVHHLAYYFRDIHEQSFNDYRNQWRVNHAKALMAEGKGKSLTMEAIGMLSGFSSRITFFTVFKKMEGVSPGAYAGKYAE